jgi:fructose-bisphosphate aldolase, class II
MGLVSGRELLKRVKDDEGCILAANIRSNVSIKGIMEAAQERDCPAIFEVTPGELKYCNLTATEFVKAVKDVARENNFSQSYAIHADHITIKENTPDAIEAAKKQIKEFKDAGFTSFAIDASHIYDAKAPDTAGKLKGNIEVTAELAGYIQGLFSSREEYGLEVEVGEIGKEATTTVDEAKTFIQELKAAKVEPDLLAINNGTLHGNNFDENGEIIPKTVDLERTEKIAQSVQALGVLGLAQHGAAGVRGEQQRLFPIYGIKKVNNAMDFQNIVFENLPDELQKRIDKWCLEGQSLESERGKLQKRLETITNDKKREEVMIDSLRKHANGQFKKEIEDLNQKDKDKITQKTREKTTELLAFWGIKTPPKMERLPVDNIKPGQNQNTNNSPKNPVY